MKRDRNYKITGILIVFCGVSILVTRIIVHFNASWASAGSLPIAVSFGLFSLLCGYLVISKKSLWCACAGIASFTFLWIERTITAIYCEGGLICNFLQVLIITDIPLLVLAVVFLGFAKDKVP